MLAVRKVLTDPACVDPQKEVKRKKQKTHMSIGALYLFICDSPNNNHNVLCYLICIFLFQANR